MHDKDRIAALDGLRGLAAIAVALLHGNSIFELDWLPVHAYLAVDFFFLLSGYVIARAFDRRLQQGWAAGFLRRRLIRLYPIIAAGSLLGVLAFTGTRSEALLDLISSLLVVPTPPLISPGWRIFPQNPPFWSLFFEVVANVIYAFAAPVLRGSRLHWFVGVTGAALGCAIVLQNGADFGLVHFKLAALRLLFSFFLGVALHRALDSSTRLRTLPGIAVPFAFAGLAFTLLGPVPPGWAYDLPAIFAVFPAVLVLAVSAKPVGKRCGTVFLGLGLCSYPIYAIHFPIFLFVYERVFHDPGAAGRAFGMAASFLGMLFFAWLLAVFYDRPARRWLSTLRLDPADLRRHIDG